VISVEATREAIYVVIRTTTVLQLDVNDGVRKIFSEPEPLSPDPVSR
jgi:hypothetical protein